MERAGGFLGQADSWHTTPKAVGEMGEVFTPGGALETHGHKQGLRGSFRQWDGQHVGKFSSQLYQLAFIKPKMLFSFVNLFTLAWLFVF